MNFGDLIQVGESVTLTDLPKPLQGLPPARIEQVAGALVRLRLEGQTEGLRGVLRSEVTMVWKSEGKEVRQPVVVERVNDDILWARIKDEQRREYMRVQTRLALWYRPIDPSDLEGACERVLEDAEPAGTLGSEADRLWGGEDVGDLINYHFTQMARFLGQIDLKLDYLIGKAEGRDVEPPAIHDLETFDLSGGGLGFFNSEPIEEGTWLEIRVQLSRLPFVEVHAIGQVIRCSAIQGQAGKRRHYIGVSFECIHDDSREAVFRFISGIERRMLRERRDILSN